MTLRDNLTLGVGARAFTFDCYGTLIDWEQGISEAIDGIPELASVDRAALLQRREDEELAIEGGPFRRYDEVLAISLQQAALTFDIRVSDGDAGRFGASVPDWPALPDAGPFLQRLRRRGMPIAILSNVTREAIRLSVRKLGVRFDLIVTADDVQSYKPAPQHWLRARAELGIEPREQLHIAASMTHDIRPCALQGVPSVWVNRHGEATPSGVEPALVVTDLVELGEALDLPPAGQGSLA